LKSQELQQETKFSLDLTTEYSNALHVSHSMNTSFWFYNIKINFLVPLENFQTS